MFSGPVILPKIYNDRNRTFFLFGYNWVKSDPAELRAVLRVQFWRLHRARLRFNGRVVQIFMFSLYGPGRNLHYPNAQVYRLCVWEQCMFWSSCLRRLASTAQISGSMWSTPHQKQPRPD